LIHLCRLIVLVGSSTRIPKVRQLLKEYFNKEPSKDINSDEAVAYGAAVQGGISSGQGGFDDIVLVNVCPLSIGIETTGEVLSPATPSSPREMQIFSTAVDNKPTVLIQV